MESTTPQERMRNRCRSQPWCCCHAGRQQATPQRTTLRCSLKKSCLKNRKAPSSNVREPALCKPQFRRQPLQREVYAIGGSSDHEDSLKDADRGRQAYSVYSETRRETSRGYK